MPIIIHIYMCIMFISNNYVFLTIKFLNVKIYIALHKYIHINNNCIFFLEITFDSPLRALVAKITAVSPGPGKLI